MGQNILTKLNFTVDIDNLREYYHILKTKYEHLNWNWEKCQNQIVKQWRDEISQDPANLLTHGWAIQSNLVDISQPCPPWNISTLPTTDYRNTILAFGIIAKLQEAIPYAYRWSVSVQPKGGKVALHSDQEDEYTVWIPIYTKGNNINFVIDDKNYSFDLESDGSVYCLDTTIDHYTENLEQEDRVTVIFRFKQRHLYHLLSIKEHFKI